MSRRLPHVSSGVKHRHFSGRRSPRSRKCCFGYGWAIPLGFLGEWMPLASESLENETGASGMRKRILAASGLLDYSSWDSPGCIGIWPHKFNSDPQLVFTATTRQRSAFPKARGDRACGRHHFTRPSTVVNSSEPLRSGEVRCGNGL